VQRFGSAASVARYLSGARAGFALPSRCRGQHLASLLDAGKGGPSDSPRAAGLLLQSGKLGHKWSVTVLGGPLTFLTPATRIELKRELARLGHYSGTIDDVWDETARAAATAYLDASQ
jgi:hypothetical protein